MSFLMAVKVLSDLCLYFGIVGGAAPWFGGTELFLLWPALLCAGGVWLAGCGQRWPVLRLVGLLPPLASLLLADSLFDYILLAPALLYTALLILTGRLDLEQDQYRSFFTHSIAAAVLLSLLVISYPLSDWRTLLLFMALYLLLGVYLMRQLRLEQRSGWNTKGLNFLSLLVTLAMGGVLCAALWLLLQLAGPVWGVVSTILVQILSVFVYVAAFLFSFLPSLKGRESEKVEALVEANPLKQLEELRGKTNSTTDQVLTIIAIVLAVLIVALVIWRMLKSTRRRSAHSRRVYSERIDVPRETGPALFRSDRDKVRRSYRKFMLLLLNRTQLQASYTTAEINNSAAFLQDGAPADRLRQLYLAARYDQETEITSQQAREAKELVKTISKDPELN